MATQVAANPGGWRTRLEWGWVETYVFVLFLSSGLLLLPGAQILRMPIRALPYVASLALLLYFTEKGGRGEMPPGARFLLGAALLLGINLFHPLTAPKAGIAQVIFQLSIAAPLLWVARAMNGRRQLDRLLWLILGICAASASFGLLQVYYPDRFMPPELSAGVELAALAQMTYEVGGRSFIRPPGLSDIPGGAALSAILAAFLGLVMGVRRNLMIGTRLFCFAAAGVGAVVLVLTSARSLTLMMVFALGVCFLVTLRQGRGVESLGLGVVAVGGLSATYLLATRIGGAEVVRRFSEISQLGLAGAYGTSRGRFLSETFDVLLPQYPLGAGIGRWGMMQNYFGSTDPQHYPIWVEIQLTGWLLDGGVLMWFMYGGALIAAMAYAYRVAVSHPDRTLAYLAAIVLGFQFMIAGTSMAGPTFNTTMGIQFWLVTGALYGAAGRPWRGRVSSPALGTSAAA